MSTVLTPTDGTEVIMATTNLNSLINSQTNGWKSRMVSNAGLKANDFRLSFYFPAPAPIGNDQAIYVYAVPWSYNGYGVFTPGGDGGGVLPLSDVEELFTISAKNNLGSPIAIINFSLATIPMYFATKLSNKFGSLMPPAWQLVVINYTGGMLATAGNVIKYTPVTYVSI